MYTIGRLARKHGLSRSTLLYYDSVGLLKPTSRTAGEYRQYSELDAKRLEQICLYRQAGLRLEGVKKVLDGPESGIAPVLENRLKELNHEIKRLRDQQLFIMGILKNSSLLEKVAVLNVETWTSFLSACGYSRDDILQWHLEFERLSPDNHHQFLKLLRIPEDQIEMIRSWVKDTDES